jgi:EVE domain
MRSYWLKSIGSSDDPQADDWVDSAPQELTEVHFPDKGKPSVAVGDYLVYYASGTSRVVGIVEVNNSVVRDSPEKRWPWRCEVKPHLVLGSIDERSPSLTSVLLPPHTTKSVMQQSHIRLSDEEYGRALAGLEDVFDPDRGDLLGEWPFFRTRLK